MTPLGVGEFDGVGDVLCSRIRARVRVFGKVYGEDRVMIRVMVQV